MIIGGDFNTYLHIKVDKKGGKPERSSRYTDNLLSLMEEFGLKDIWRQRNPEDLKFTRREHTKAGIVQSRLDYFLVSGIVTYNILDTSIKPGCKSDHSIIRICLNVVKSQRRGSSYWKFNNKLLTDKDYIALIKKEINDITVSNTLQNSNTMWDFVKCQL